ncbi:MAG: sulfotransferase [Planctomycetota bacterium]
MLTADDLACGQNLAFVIGPFRGGTTLLRKVIDSHPALYSPAETWFLLPLLRMIDGTSKNNLFKQTAVAISHHLDVQSQRGPIAAYAGAFYAQTLARSTKPGASWFVDKTPRYLEIAHLLPTLFPKARFILLARDPRAVLWSRWTWEHNTQEDYSILADSAARDTRALADFTEGGADRKLLVHYERLCREPQSVAAEITEFLGVEPCATMSDYGMSVHHEGWGDHLTKRHARPHTKSIERFAELGQMTQEQSDALLEAVGERALKALALEHILETKVAAA